jgi:nucleoside-diphosphate-sugar epimerase
MTTIHTVLGAAGTIGRELVPLLEGLGVPVRAVTRRPTAPRSGVEPVVADVATADGARLAVEGSHTVYVCVQPAYTRWVEEFAPLVATVADAATAAGARLVVLDNLYGYGATTQPLTERTPQDATSRKGRVRAEIARDLLARSARGDLAVGIGRAADFVGPTGTSVPNLLTLQPVAAGRRGRWLGRLDRAHSVAATADVARFLAVLDHAFGRAWHLPVSGSPTGREFVELAHRLGGVEASPGLITPLMNRMAGLFSPVVREGNELMHQWTEPFVVDDSAFRAAFPGHAPTPLAEAVAAALAGRRAGAPTSTR